MEEYITTKILLGGTEVFMVNPSVTVKKCTGDHTRLHIQGMVKEASYQLLAGLSSMASLKVQLDGREGYLFSGVVTYTDVQVIMSEGKQYQELSLEAMSETCLMDRNKKNVSFQKKSASYKEILDFAMKEYAGSNYILSAEADGKSIDRFVVQYHETDWEFLSRLASFLRLPLVASHNTAGVKFTMGVVWKNNTYTIPPEDECQVETIFDSLAGKEKPTNSAPSQKQYLRWKVEDVQAPYFDPGDCVSYQGVLCYIKEAQISIKDHYMTQTCLMCSKECFTVPEIENQHLTGLSLPGSVKEVKSNQLKIKLDIDAWPEQDCWFVYSTFYSTFYCMPEKEDRINLYFPNHTEGNSFVLNSVRKSPQEAVAAMSSRNQTGENGVENGGSSGSGSSSGQAKEPVQVDISPYLNMLASPQYGKLINVNADFAAPSAAPSSGGSQQTPGSSGMTSGGSGGSAAAGGTGGAKQDYDFQTMAENENIKVLCTKGGRMVILDDATGSVSVLCDNGTFIGLAKQGISIVTDQNITFQAAKDIKLKAGTNIYISAETQIQVNCKESGMIITPESVMINGTDIKLNE